MSAPIYMAISNNKKVMFSNLYSGLVHEANRCIYVPFENNKPFSLKLLKSKGLIEVPVVKENEKNDLSLVTLAFIVPILKDNGTPYTHALVRMTLATFHPGDPDLSYLYAIAVNGRFSEAKYDQVKAAIETIAALAQVEIPILHDGYYWRLRHAHQNNNGSSLAVKVISAEETVLLAERIARVNTKGAEGQPRQYEFSRQYILYDGRIWYSRPELYNYNRYDRFDNELCNGSLRDDPEYFLNKLYLDAYLCVGNELYGLSSAEVQGDCVRLLSLYCDYRNDGGHELKCAENENNNNYLTYTEIKSQSEDYTGDKKPQLPELTENDLPATVMGITIYHPLVLGKIRRTFKEGETVYSKKNELYGLVDHDYGLKSVSVLLENGYTKDIAIQDVKPVDIPVPSGDPLVNRIVLARSGQKEKRLSIGRVLECYPNYAMLVLDKVWIYSSDKDKRGFDELSVSPEIVYVPKDYLVVLDYNFEPPTERAYKARYFGDKETTPQAISTKTWATWFMENHFSYKDDPKSLTLYAIFQFDSDRRLPLGHAFAVAELTDLYFKKHRGQCDSPYMFMTLFKKLQALTDETENITEILKSESHLAVLEFKTNIA